MLKDRFGNPIQIGDRIAFVFRPNGPADLMYGAVIDTMPGHVRISSGTDREYYKPAAECVILDLDDHRVTMFVLEKSVP